jgi:glyoxylase-like metal-dependent hydrolase (beta-lactamase superfamily II)
VISAVAALLVTVAIARPQGRSAEPVKLTVNKVKDGLYEIDGGGGNSVLYVTSEGAILVDAKNLNDAAVDALMEAIRSVTDKPVKYVFITHYHQDHIGGTARFLRMGAQVISTVNTRNYMLGPQWKSVRVFDNNGKFLREQPYYPAERGVPTPPPLVFDREVDVFLGGKEVRARYLGTAHTDGDAFIFFPSERTVAVGDTMKDFDGPFIDYPAGGSIVEYIKTIDGLLKLPGGRKIEGLDDYDVVIPGHGPVSDRAGLLAHRNKLLTLRDTILSMKHAGKSYGDIAAVMASTYGWKPEDRNLGQWTFPGLMKELK